jgi:hypothetical protein
MPITIRGKSDPNVDSMAEGLLAYERDHPDSEIEIYRYNSISLRLRVKDPAFAGVDKFDRHEQVWKYLEKLPDEVQGDITMLVLLAPGEEADSLANFEFEKPSRSLL